MALHPFQQACQFLRVLRLRVEPVRQGVFKDNPPPGFPDIDPAGLEFTVEAGRPDTITPDKIKAMLRHGVGRISINPQSMKAETLKAIGRDHTPDDVREAFRIVRSSEKEFFSDLCGDTDNNSIIINTDIIAGLPGEDVSDIEQTLREIIELGADNITVHSLAVKRASRLAAQDRDYHYRQGRIVTEMLDAARKMLGEADYRPYYLYRQKHMSGAQENTGYCLEGSAGIYNVRIMDEHQRIIAMGAGGISKAYVCRKSYKVS